MAHAETSPPSGTRRGWGVWLPVVVSGLALLTWFGVMVWMALRA